MQRLIAFLALWLAIVAPATPQEKLAGGPYTVNAGPRQATVMWVVERGQASIAAAGSKLNKTAPALRVEKVSFSGLQPGTSYTVTAPDGSTASFKTAPVGAAQFRFVVFGDTRTRHDVHRRAIEAIMKYGSPDFVIHTGDLVADGADTAQWPIFFSIERELLRTAAFYPVLGNHERNDRQYYEFFDAVTPYYSFNWGTSHFTILNSDLANLPGGTPAHERYWAEQVRWLEEDLQKSQSADLRFVVAHHPPITALKNRQAENAHVTALMPMFEKYKVQAAFFGHDHNYQHYLRNGIHYFVTGGGGAPLYGVEAPPEGITRKVASVENFTVIKVNGKIATVDALLLDGATLDSTEIGR
jgi:predicted phosphodiesterase